MTKKQNYSVVCLDMGDTLASANPNWDTTEHQVYTRIGLPVTLQEIAAANARANGNHQLPPASLTYPATEEYTRAAIMKEIASILSELGYHDPALCERAYVSWREVYTDPATYRLFPDTLPALKALHERGYRLGVISNWDWCLPELLAALGLAHYFEVIAVSARVGASKPHPSIFHYALNHFGVQPERVLHVGDNPEADAEGAQAAGMTGVLLDRRGVHRTSGRYPVIRQLTELVDALEGNSPTR